MPTAVRWVLRILTLLMLLAMGAVAGSLLVGCGGGDPEPAPDQPHPTVDCKAHPEQCR